MIKKGSCPGLHRFVQHHLRPRAPLEPRVPAEGAGGACGDARRIRSSSRLRSVLNNSVDAIELNLFVGAVGESPDKVDLTIMRQVTGLDDDVLLQLPGVLIGSPSEIADRLLRYRDEFGISYISVLDSHMSAFAEVIKHLR
jgi:hypothetical protein